ncbi:MULTISPECIES: helix-turn-helix domain-containing protein [Streptomycetaceae]|uniref:helix-turn-helix domain-containing protein n=1 Tax=Streptomycetaceae TaxID=2062 RepID=UPI000939D188|nr:helix-turn-helix domain-containing protein [Streptomyces sp. CB02056]OKI02815.1 hypothetical protein AMK13_29755 [Streptomyces sp. CB02056]
MTARPVTFAEAFELPLTVDVRTAARAFGVCVATAYKMIHAGRFPCLVLRFGRCYRIPTALLLRALGIEERPIYAADMAEGADFAARWGSDTPCQEDVS